MENIITLGIMGIILTILGNFTLTNIKKYSIADSELELQYHSQIAMNEIIDKVLRTKGISISNEKAAVVFCNSSEQKIRKISFDNTAGATPSMNTLVIEHKFGALFYGYGDRATVAATVVFANYVHSFIIKPMPLGSSYSDCKGIQIIIAMEKENVELVIENEIYFRN